MTERPTDRSNLDEVLADLPDDSWERAFLEQYEVSLGNIAEAARKTGIDRRAVYRRKQSDPAFARAFRNAQDALIDSLEAEVLRRAHDGVEEPVFRNGKEVGSRRHYSDTLAQFLLKTRKPEVYGAHPASSSGLGGAVKVQEILASWRARLGAEGAPDDDATPQKKDTPATAEEKESSR